MSEVTEIRSGFNEIRGAISLPSSCPAKVEPLASHTEIGDSVSPESNQSPSKREFPKTHQDHWKEKLRKRSFKKKDGQTKEISDWQIRIKYAGKEAWFNLHTSNKAAASVKKGPRYLPFDSFGRMGSHR